MTSSRERYLRVVLFSDVVGSSERIFADELIAVQHIKSDLALIREALQKHGGSLVKSLGDGILATFDAPTQALEFVEDVVVSLANRTGYSLQHRFGIHVGEIYADGDDIIGQGVHLASRLQTIAPPNGVAFARTTYEMVDAVFRRRSELMGHVSLPGLPDSIVCYSISEQAMAGGSAPSAHSTTELILRGVQDVLSGSPYRLERPLGRSDLSRTFLVRERHGDQHAVLKMFPGDPGALEALAVEAACLDRISNGSIPRVIDGFERAGHYCLLQEWIPGPSLNGSLDYLRKKQRISELLRQVLEVLEMIHQLGIVHGDVHPSNLIPSLETRQLFVVDFSLVKSRAGQLSSDLPPTTGTFSPTEADLPGQEGVNARAYYSPPERARFGRIWPGVDLYSLGVTALRLYTGRHPRQLYDQVLGVWNFSDLDPEVVGWLKPMLEESPGRRIKGAADALQLLDRPGPSATVDSGSLRDPPDAPALEKQQLQQALTEIYGPVVELLMEQCASTIPSGQVEVLRQRLLEAGLRSEDIAAAIEQATPSPASADVEGSDPARAMLLCAAGPDTGQLPAAARPALFAVLSRSIGPVADLLLSGDLILRLLEDDETARSAVASLPIPEEAASALLQEAELLRQGVTAPMTSFGAETGFGSGERSETSGSPEGTAAPGVDVERLRRSLLDLLGPIGEEIYAEVCGSPSADQLNQAVAALEHYAIDPDLIARLRQRCQAPPGSGGRP